MGDYLFHVDPRSTAEDGSELAIQQRFRRDMRKLAPKVRLPAVPNGGQRSQWAGMKAKAEGMAKGFPDLVAVAPGRKVAFIEMKSRDGKLAPDQIDWLNWLTLAGFPCGCFNNSVNAIDFLRANGFPFLAIQTARVA